MPTTTRVEEMIRMLDDAVERQEVHGCCLAVKDALEQIVASGEDFIPSRSFVQRRVRTRDACCTSILRVVTR